MPGTKGCWLRNYKRYLNQIWYRAQTPVYHHAKTFYIHLQKSKMVVAAILNFRKSQYFRIGWKYFHQIWCTDVSQPYGDDRMNRSRNRKLIRMTSSVNCQMLGAQVHWSRGLWQILQTRLVQSSSTIIVINVFAIKTIQIYSGWCQIQLLWQCKMAAATVIEVWGDFCWVPISSKSGVNHEQINWLI